MTDREKLIKLLKENCHSGQHCQRDCDGCIADHLIANGVTVLECIPAIEELKPCPFCGGKAEEITHYLYGKAHSYSVVCKKCRCELGIYASKQGARNAWNRRR